MVSGLIGHTGFVGSNLSRQFHFDDCYHSPTIAGIRGKQYDLLVCSGVTALKWWANQNEVEDRSRIDSLLGHLAHVRARHAVVISTVDVYPKTRGVDEQFDCHSLPNHVYGVNRLYFEEKMREIFEEVTILRISGVFGPGLKKNVLFDLSHGNCLDAINPESSFQYYNITRLWSDIERVREAGIRLVNFVSEPVRTGDVIRRYFPDVQVGGKGTPQAAYDIRTIHSEAMQGPGDYTTTAAKVMDELEAYFATVQGANA